MNRHFSTLTVASLALAAPAALAQTVFPEVEPNDTKAQATVVQGMASGDSITGNSTGTSTSAPGPASADYFLISSAPAPLGVYRHRMVLSAGGSTAHTITLRGLNQVATGAGPWPCEVGTPGTTDTSLQTAFIPTGTTTRLSQWYGFGKGERIYYRVTGTSATTANYTATLETVPVPVVEVGSLLPGPITITALNQGHSTDTDFWVYDADFNAIPGYGNDDNSTDGGGSGSGFMGHLVRTFDAGIYHLAISIFQMAHNQPSPCDDRYRTGTLTDFPDVVLNSSSTLSRDVTFTISDKAGNSYQVPATRADAFEVLFFRFVVGGDEFMDCNGNGIDDAQEIAADLALDCFSPLALASPHTSGGPDGFLDACQCLADWNRNGAVNSADITDFLTSWLAAVSGGPASADINCSGGTDSADLATYLTRWLAAAQSADPIDNCP